MLEKNLCHKFDIIKIKLRIKKEEVMFCPVNHNTMFVYLVANSLFSLVCCNLLTLVLHGKHEITIYWKHGRIKDKLKKALKRTQDICVVVLCKLYLYRK